MSTCEKCGGKMMDTGEMESLFPTVMKMKCRDCDGMATAKISLPGSAEFEKAFIDAMFEGGVVKVGVDEEGSVSSKHISKAAMESK